MKTDARNATTTRFLQRGMGGTGAPPVTNVCRWTWMAVSAIREEARRRREEREAGQAAAAGEDSETARLCRSGNTEGME